MAVFHSISAFCNAGFDILGTNNNLYPSLTGYVQNPVINITVSCASLLLANGVPLKHIQEWLGHSDFTTTANIYAHLDYSSKITSAQAMETGLALPESGDFGSRWENGEAQI